MARFFKCHPMPFQGSANPKYSLEFGGGESSKEYLACMESMHLEQRVYAEDQYGPIKRGPNNAIANKKYANDLTLSSNMCRAAEKYVSPQTCPPGSIVCWEHTHIPV